MIVAADALEAWATDLGVALGYRAEDARFLARSLVDANLRGVDSHGVIRFPIYATRIEHHLVNPDAVPLVTTKGGVISVDANGTAGQIAARAAVDELVIVSESLGLATATVHGSTHFGAAGYYARLLAERGRVAFVVSNSEPIVVPHGGREALLGTNPFAFAAPTSSAPLSLDMATSTVAMGKVMVALSRHESIPRDWGVDESGQATDDPAAVKALFPVGGPKGYGLGMVVEILGGVLSGASIARDLGDQYSDLTRPQGTGHWMLALNIEAFMPRDEFSARMATLVGMVRSTEPVDQARPVLLPGEPEELTSAKRAVEGIPLPDDTVAELTELSERYSVPLFGQKQ